MQQFEVRQARPGDRDTLYRIRREAMRPYVEQVWGWDEELQERRFCESYDHTETQVVIVDGLAVGLLRVSESESALFIDQVEIVPDYQGRGIGTALINDLLARGRPVELRLMKVTALGMPTRAGSTNGWAFALSATTRSTTTCGRSRPVHIDLNPRTKYTRAASPNPARGTRYA